MLPGLKNGILFNVLQDDSTASRKNGYFGEHMTRFVQILQGFSLPSATDVTRLTGWINALLVLFLAYTMATLTWQALSGLSDQGSVTMAPVPGTTVQHSSGPGLDTLAGLHLFGEAGAVPAVTEEPIDAPETRLKFTLKGVFADSRSDTAMAIIDSGGKDEKSYRVGDVVAGAATLHQILADRVILKRGEQLETLYLPKENLSGASSSPTYQRAISSNVNRFAGGRTINRGSVSDLRRTLLENPQDALQLINAQPVMENGQLSGFRVNPGKDRALFARVGLRPGDIITSVNGMQLSDATQMGQVFQQLKSAQQLQVTINRGGREQQLQLKLD